MYKMASAAANIAVLASVLYIFPQIMLTHFFYITFIVKALRPVPPIRNIPNLQEMLRMIPPPCLLM